MRLDAPLDPSWRAALRDELEAPYMTELDAFLANEAKAGYRVFPPPAARFAALNATPLDRVRVVILGQDPYHGEAQAHGLAFSVPPGVRPPPSLINIFKELGIREPRHGTLSSWAAQGVLLLNSVLTVRMGSPGSHAGRGWERFTDAVIRAVDARSEPAVFMLWGKYAQAKAAFVDPARHLVLAAPHPSPFSAASGFFGCDHFERANAFLESRGQPPVEWRSEHRPLASATPVPT